MNLDESGCSHHVVPHRDGFGRCTKCGDDSFPITCEAAGRFACCGSYSEHEPGCDGVTRQTWALAKGAEQELERAIAMVDFGGSKKALRERLRVALDSVRRIRWEGADPPPYVDKTVPSFGE